MHRPIVFLLTWALVVGCSDAFSPSGVSGSYTLLSVDGAAIPATLASDGALTLTFTSGSLTLTQSQTWQLSVVFTASDGTSGVSEESTSSGTFTLIEPDSIRFVDAEGDITAGTVGDNRVTLVDVGVTFVFAK